MYLYLREPFCLFQEFMPTKDEEMMLLNFNGEKHMLAPAEKVLRRMLWPIKAPYFFCRISTGCSICSLSRVLC